MVMIKLPWKPPRKSVEAESPTLLDKLRSLPWKHTMTSKEVKKIEGSLPWKSHYFRESRCYFHASMEVKSTSMEAMVEEVHSSRIVLACTGSHDRFRGSDRASMGVSLDKMLTQATKVASVVLSFFSLYPNINPNPDPTPT